MKMGGLGIRSMVQLVPSVFLASATATSNLVHCIILSHLQGSPVLNIDDAKVLWSEGYNHAPPEDTAKHQQKVLDVSKATALAKSLLESALDTRVHTCFLASTAKES